jgi:ferredoxin
MVRRFPGSVREAAALRHRRVPPQAQSKGRRAGHSKARIIGAVEPDAGNFANQPALRTMSLTITDECINCDVCEPECPNEAIYLGPEIYEIDPHKCTECVGHFDEPQCVQVCPVACIPVHPDFIEDKETLWRKYRRLQGQSGAAD